MLTGGLTTLLLAALHSEEWSEGPTWCTYGTCSDVATYIPWAHGNGGIERTCVAKEPPYNITNINSFDLTIWSALAGATSANSGPLYGAVTNSSVAEKMQIVIKRAGQQIIWTQDIDVTPTPLRVILSFNTTEPLWARLQSDPGQGVVAHYVFFKWILYQAAQPPPPGEIVCMGGNNHMCTVVGYSHSSSCELLPPAPPTQPLMSPPPPCGTDDCLCQCCMPDTCPTLQGFTFRAGSADKCRQLDCAARYSICPDPGAHNEGGLVNATYVPTPACYDPSAAAPSGGGIDAALLVPIVAVATVLAVAVVGLLSCLCYVRRRERRGEPIWHALESIVAPADASHLTRTTNPVSLAPPSRGSKSASSVSSSSSTRADQVLPAGAAMKPAEAEDPAFAVCGAHARAKEAQASNRSGTSSSDSTRRSAGLQSSSSPGRTIV